jgi:hypothetical protein
MRSDEDSGVVRRDSVVPGQAIGLTLRVMAAVVLGTIGFYVSVAVAYDIADADMSSPETFQAMFPPGEHWVLADVVATSALIYLLIAKGGLYRTIVDAGFVGWISLGPVVAALTIVLRALAIDPVYFPIHYDTTWSLTVYEFLIYSPLEGAAPYVLDGLWLFAGSMLLSVGLSRENRG